MNNKLDTKLSIIIPCFNEPLNVSLVIGRFKELLPKYDNEIELIFVDGCSTDKTALVLENELKALNKDQFKLILMKERKGYGYDINYALGTATGNILSWTHADMQTDPKDVLDAFELYKKASKSYPLLFVKGRRKNRRFMEAFFTFGMQLITFFLLRSYLDDINAQPKLFSKDFYEKHIKQDAPTDFSLDLYVLYKAKQRGYTILTIPVYFAKRKYGIAKGGGGSWKNRVNLITRTFKYIVKLRKDILL